MPYLTNVCNNGSLITCTVISLTAARFKPLILSVDGFALFYDANTHLKMCNASKYETHG
jgi:hypothetical protein